MRLKEIRKKRRLKQNELADLLEISQVTISKYENNKLNVNNDMIMKICFVLDVTPNELLGWEEAYHDYVTDLIRMKKEG